ncbi:hypothetical protein [Arthrobacter sp. ISL-72]|uniref:hypothetical protein n=1 Tax=Arthrobacter sp. ISL-72 TaxID=2819114 RepID=UPI001BE94E29|nr:hypothetical protein [Arthrobacter sp. ISL-72]MBT2594482.1 hypothetical protein [Arthrobacter sp. ISL-72]
MKKIIAALALAGLAGLTGCAGTAGPGAETGAPTMEASSAPAGSPSASDSATADATSASSAASTADAAADAAGTLGAKEACEKFNTLFAEYKAVAGTDANAYEDIYLRAEDAKETVSGDLEGLFSALSLLAIDRSAAVESGGEVEQESKDAVRDAVFANAGTCTAEGVTLRL